MPFLSGYTNRKKITIDSSLVDATETDVPVHVALDSSNFDFSLSESDGSDIKFTSADGTTLLSFEREKHSAVDEEAYYFVKIPSVSDSVDTDFYIYFGNPLASDSESKEDVWDSAYSLVLHGNTDVPFEDSTANSNDGTARQDAFVSTATKKLGEGSFYLDGGGDAIIIPNSTDFHFGTGDFSIKAWIKLDDASRGGPENIFAYSTSTGAVQFFVGAGGIYVWGMTSIVLSVVSAGLMSDTWYYLEFRREGNLWEINLDGVTVASATDGRALGNPIHGNQILIGLEVTGPSQPYKGFIDDIYVSKGDSRGDAYNKILLNSENGTLLTFGDLEDSSENISITVTSTIDSSDFQNYAENLGVSSISSVTVSDLQEYLESNQINITGVVSVSDFQAILEDILINISSVASQWNSVPNSGSPISITVTKSEVLVTVGRKVIIFNIGVE